ncbi:MAG: cysteine--tRNA ligase [Acidimicrobiia bacterium]|nr:cysteine--tRNA ligase [Acidimicrobiia bacterium]
MIHLFDTAKGAVVPLETREPQKVSMYVCGPTVDGAPHIGHGRMTLVFDVLRRYLEWSGYEVHHVSNVTDIDDKIINRAEREGREPADVAREFEALWWEGIDAIGVARPHDDPHATAWVGQMVEMIGALVERGVAYEISDGVYLEVSKVDGYGLLARQSLDSLQAGARVDANGEKRSPVDFVLWKKSKPGEPTWPSPWGDGRPGWHTECVVMSLGLLGDGFDIHGGGIDLTFPHHENERAQAVALGRPFARHWMHNGFVEVDGEKMSKSLGNFANLIDLVRSTDPRSYRLLVLQSHYRSPMEVTKDTIAQARQAIHRLDAFARRTADIDSSPGSGIEPDPALISKFREVMDGDLNTAGAMTLVFQLVRTVNQSLDIDDLAGAEPAVAAVRSMCQALGLELNDEPEVVPDDIIAMAEEREAARAARDFGRADSLRDAITGAGWILDDSAGGTTIRRA